MTSVNLYDVLNITQECTPKEIKDAYRKLAKEFHPDKPDGDVEMFELVTHAYNILIHATSRKEYDELHELSKQSDSSHFDLKSKSAGFYKALETDVTAKKKNDPEQTINFKKVFDEMDRKHGYKREKEHYSGLDEKITKKGLSDLQLAREHDDIENMQEQIFDASRFDLAKFNAAFDKVNKIHNELIPHNGNPDAYNTISGFGISFSPIDNYDNLYAEDDTIGTTSYSSIKLDPGKNKKLTKADLEKLPEAVYTKGHSFKDKGYDKQLEEKIKERDITSKILTETGISDFDTDPNCGGYGIFSQLGINGTNTLNWDNDEDIKTRYKRLVESRKTD
jgi:curved DNA-binding protein CbpA